MRPDFDTRNKINPNKPSYLKCKIAAVVLTPLFIACFISIVSLRALIYNKPKEFDLQKVINNLVKIFKPQTTPKGPRISPRGQMRVIETAMNTFLLNTGQYPTTLNDLVQDPGLQGWCGPYLKSSQLLDPWGRSFIYIPGGRIDGGPLLIYYGKDGKPGGKGEDADVDNNEKGKQK